MVGVDHVVVDEAGHVGEAVVADQDDRADVAAVERVGHRAVVENLEVGLGPSRIARTGIGDRDRLRAAGVERDRIAGDRDDVARIADRPAGAVDGDEARMATAPAPLAPVLPLPIEIWMPLPPLLVMLLLAMSASFRLKAVVAVPVPTRLTPLNPGLVMVLFETLAWSRSRRWTARRGRCRTGW